MLPAKTMITRRALLLGGGFAAITSRKGFSLAAQAQQIAVRADAEIGRVRPELHGHFAEHLGTCIYGGLWFGRNSKLPNEDGYNAAALRDLKALGIPVLRWPGGCYADDYHWRDGIGANRRKTVNIHWGNYVEDGSFGTHEFIGLCRRIGAEPYLAGNVGSGTPQELREWVEYCNYPEGSTLADERIANGAREPFQVKYWGVGNENWGCGGSMRPEYYADLYRRYQTYVRNYGDQRIYKIACGANSADYQWTEVLMRDNVTYRNAVRFGQVVPNKHPVKFYFEQQEEAEKVMEGEKTE
jgi:alpha-N-arabinofuranosidase